MRIGYARVSSNTQDNQDCKNEAKKHLKTKTILNIILNSRIYRGAADVEDTV